MFVMMGRLGLLWLVLACLSFVGGQLTGGLPLTSTTAGTTSAPSTSPTASSGNDDSTRYLQLDFGGVLDGAGCPGSGIVTQAAWDAKCATCECSNFGCCRPPDCDNVACGGSGAPGGPAVPCTVTDCTICTSGGPEGHPCVRTPVLRQCSFSQGVTVMDPFQAIAKVSVVYWASTAYAWVNYAANSERSSLAFISNNASDPTTLGQSIFLGQPANVLPSQPGFGSADGPQLFYSTGVFGPLNWTVLEPRMTRVGVRLCTTGATPTCTTYSCTFGSDKPVLRPDQV